MQWYSNRIPYYQDNTGETILYNKLNITQRSISESSMTEKNLCYLSTIWIVNDINETFLHFLKLL